MRRNRLTEGRLRGIVHEAVKRVLWEAKHRPWQEMIGTEMPNLTPIDCEFNDMYGETEVLCENADDGNLALCSEKTRTRQRVRVKKIDISNPHAFFRDVMHLGLFMVMSGGMRNYGKKFVVLLRSILEYTGRPELFDECDKFDSWDEWSKEIGL